MGRKFGIAGAILAFAVNACLSFGAAAQEYKFENIDCAQSRIVAAAGMNCRATAAVADSSATGGGMFKRYSVAGTTPEGYTHYFLWEGVDSRSHIRITESLADFLKWMNNRAQGGSQFSAVSRYQEVDYLTFRNKEQQPCAGFRRLGNSRGAGYAWVMGGMKCWSGAKDVTPAQITQLIDGGVVR